MTKVKLLALRNQSSDNALFPYLLFSKVLFFICFISAFLSTYSVHAEVLEDNKIKVGSSIISVTFAPGVGEKGAAVNQKELLQWIDQSAHAVSGYFNGFPVEKLNLAINPSTNVKKVGGSAYHGEIPLVMIKLNLQASLSSLQTDWVMVHEMVHLAFPPMKRRHHWIEEGLSTYVEPLARVKAGIIREEELWRWLIKGTPQGLPAYGDKGLDNTPTWGRTYWGGAIYFLLADIKIHRQTKNRFGIEDSLRAIIKSGGTMALEKTWPINKTLTIGDKATGTNVLVTLYNEMKDKPMAPDLPALWKRLGVSLENGKIVYDDSAPDANLRRALIKG